MFILLFSSHSNSFCVYVVRMHINISCLTKTNMRLNIIKDSLVTDLQCSFDLHDTYGRQHLFVQHLFYNVFMSRGQHIWHATIVNVRVFGNMYEADAS